MSASKMDVLPCPFCGAADIIVSYYEFRGDDADQYPQDVVCPNCPAGFCGHEFKGQGTAAVIAAWNRRAHSAAVAELIEATIEFRSGIAALVICEEQDAPQDIADAVAERYQKAVDRLDDALANIGSAS